MIFNLRLDPKCTDEIIAHVRTRTPLVDEIERLVQENSVQDAVPGYVETVSLLNQNAKTKYHVNVGIGAEEYYRMKESRKE